MGYGWELPFPLSHIRVTSAHRARCVMEIHVLYIGIKLNGIINRAHTSRSEQFSSSVNLTLSEKLRCRQKRRSIILWRDSHSTPKNNNIIISKWKRNEKRYVVDTSESCTHSHYVHVRSIGKSFFFARHIRAEGKKTSQHIAPINKV